MGQLANSTNEEFTEYKTSVQTIENDLLQILRNYKDVLADLEHINPMRLDIEEIQRYLEGLNIG